MTVTPQLACRLLRARRGQLDRGTRQEARSTPWITRRSPRSRGTCDATACGHHSVQGTTKHCRRRCAPRWVRSLEMLFVHLRPGRAVCHGVAIGRVQMAQSDEGCLRIPIKVWNKVESFRPRARRGCKCVRGATYEIRPRTGHTPGALVGAHAGTR